MSSDLQSSLALPTAQTTRRQEPESQSTLAAAVTTVVDVHAIIPDPDFRVEDDAIATMLEEASGPYRSVDVRFRLAGVERTNEPLLTRDQGSDIPTSGFPLHIEMPRQARAVRYPGKLVIFFRHYHDSPAFKAFSYSSYWADYVVMGEAGAAKFAHEAGHYFNLSHTHNDASTGRLDQVNRDRGFQATLNEAVELMRLAQGPACFDGDFPAVRDTPPDPGPPLFQPTGNNPSEHCAGTRTLRVPGLAEPVTLAPDRRNVMSYFGGCQATDRGHFSPDQVTIVRATLLSGNRRQLASGVTFEGPAVTALSDGTIQVFARGDDRGIWCNVGRQPEKGNWTGWRPDLRGGTLSSGPAAVTLTGDHVHVFARGDDRDIWHNWLSPGSDWVGWRPDMPSGGTTFTSGPAATVLKGDKVHLFTEGDDRNIWHNSWLGQGNWTGWTLDMHGDGATFMW